MRGPVLLLSALWAVCATAGKLEGATLKVVSYNVMHDGGKHKTLTSPEVRFAALVSLLRSENADVVCLQEVRANLHGKLKAELGDVYK
jgi:endonuclease/exonuclease/phosphatase family metal-dependent hydrolase